MTSDNDDAGTTTQKEEKRRWRKGFTARCDNDDGQSSDVKKGTDDSRERDDERGTREK